MSIIDSDPRSIATRRGRPPRFQAPVKPVEKHETKPSIQPRALSIDQAAAYVGIHRTSIYRLVNRGKLTLRKIGGRSIILRDDLDALLEASAAPVSNHQAA